MSEWRELTSLQEVAAAQAAGEEIESFLGIDNTWCEWGGDWYSSNDRFRSRPRKKTKIVVMRESFMHNKTHGTMWYAWSNNDLSNHNDFVRYTGNERTEEVGE